MKIKRACVLTYLLGGCLISTASAYDPGADDPTSVSARASPDYIRVREADGTFVPEMYAFGKGGFWPGNTSDYSIDRIEFQDVARIIAYPLATQRYYPASVPANTRLLIMVYWGSTGQILPGTSGSLAEMISYRNMKMLGYDSWYQKTFSEWGNLKGTALELNKHDLESDLLENRYFVVLMAYDFRLMWRERKHKLLWETRFSIREMHHEFDKELPNLSLSASRYFGQDSGGLVREKVPHSQVEIGDVKDLGEAMPSEK